MKKIRDGLEVSKTRIVIKGHDKNRRIFWEVLYQEDAHYCDEVNVFMRHFHRNPLDGPATKYFDGRCVFCYFKKFWDTATSFYARDYPETSSDLQRQ